MTRNEVFYLIGGAILARVLNLPFQLAGGLMLPSVQRWVEARAKARAFAKSRRMRAEYEEAHYFFTYPHRMTQYFLNRGLELFRLSLFLFLLLWLMPRVPILGQKGIWGTMLTFFPFAAAMYLLFSISGAVNKLHDIYYRAEFWGEYKKKVELELPGIAEEIQNPKSSMS